MYKKIFYRILISALLVFACAILLKSNIQFCAITSQRYLAIEDSFYGWSKTTNALYNDSIQNMDEFSEEGDYQKWLVTSGSTYTGKIVRGLVMSATFLLFILSGYVCIGNIVGLFRRTLRDIRRSARRRTKQQQKLNTRPQV